MHTFAIFNRIRGRWYPAVPELGDLPMLLLLHLAFLFFLPIVFGLKLDVRFFALTFLSLALFLPIYFAAWRERRAQRLLVWVLAIVLLGMVTMQFNPGGNTYLIYGAAFSANMVKFRSAMALYLWVCFAGVLAAVLNGSGAFVYVGTLLISTAVFFGNRLSHSAAKHSALLRLSQEEVARLAKMAERERIARDLHDLIGHTLTVVALKTQLARKLVERNPQAAMQEMQALEDLAREALTEVRQTVHGMRSAELPVELAKSRLALGAAQITLHDQPTQLNLPQAHEHVLASVMREAVNNIVRHSRANAAWIEWARTDHGIVLKIRDNGRCTKLIEGHGLQAMRERLATIGGALTLQYSAQGVALTAHISDPDTAKAKPASENASARVSYEFAKSPTAQFGGT